MQKIFLACLLVLCSLSGHAEIKLPRFFGNNMVLQRDQKIPVWGWASPKEKITVQFKQQTLTTAADKSGKWRIDLNPEPAGGPFQLMVKGKKQSLTFENILLGDVWICSGQSNMEWQVRSSDNAEQEIRSADYPMIRHFAVPKTVASTPKDDVTGGEWQVCSPETVAGFTAVGYFFARHLWEELNIPIGLLHTSWGGTHVETWTSKQAFENDDHFKSMISRMPWLNLDSIAREKELETKAHLQKLQQGVDGTEESKWKEPSYDHSKWPQMKAPGLWEQQSIGNVDGTVWMRKTFTLAADKAGKTGVLEMAMIDDQDETYLNGVKIGATNQYNEKRTYPIPAQVLKEGQNVIAVKITDTGGGGGIYGGPADLKVSVGDYRQSLAGDWHFLVSNVSAAATGIGPNRYPTLLFNGMIQPLIPFGIKGAIWYQGESNAGRAYEYRRAFPLMIKDWRERWSQGDFPFYFVQLATFNANNGNSEKGSTWAELREAQSMTLALPNTGMAITTDIGNPKDIHPRNKKDVGKRLAALALKQTYGKNIVSQGPIYSGMKVEKNKIILSFSNTGSGLVAKGDKYNYLKGFEIAGSDQKFMPAQAYIEADKVVVFQHGIENPQSVRFGWVDDASENNLFNKQGFPAGPFRTDNWKGITEEARFKVEN